MIAFNEPLPVLEQTAIAWRAVKHLQKHGIEVRRVACGHYQKPVIHIAANRAAVALRDAEPHCVCGSGPGTIDVMVTDYRGCQVTWSEPRGNRHAG